MYIGLIDIRQTLDVLITSKEKMVWYYFGEIIRDHVVKSKCNYFGLQQQEEVVVRVSSFASWVYDEAYYLLLVNLEGVQDLEGEIWY